MRVAPHKNVFAGSERATRALSGDYWLAAGCVAGIIAVVVALGQESLDPGPAVAAREISTLSFASSAVRRRPVGTLVWDVLSVGARSQHEDTIFVPPGGHAVFTFDDGTSLEVDQNSLVVLEDPDDTDDRGSINISLVRGNVLGRAGERGLEIATVSGTATLPAGSAASMDHAPDSGSRLEVVDGEASVTAGGVRKGLSKSDGATLRAGAEPTAEPAPKAQLSAPARNQRFFVGADGVTIALSWREAAPGLRIQVARDRLFSKVAVEAAAQRGAFDVRVVEEGPWYWRLVDGDGEAQSQRWTFYVVRDVPAQLSSPRDVTVLQSAQRSVRFSWKPVSGVAQYHFELSDTAHFAAVLATRESRSSTMWLDESLSEGVYYWRVRAQEEERGISPWSRPGRFRLIKEALPDAPQLFDVEFQLERSAGPEGE